MASSGGHVPLSPPPPLGPALKPIHVANCEYLLLSISCEMNADQSLFVVDLNERRSDSTNLVWSIMKILHMLNFSWRIIIRACSVFIRIFQ